MCLRSGETAGAFAKTPSGKCVSCRACPVARSSMWTLPPRAISRVPLSGDAVAVGGITCVKNTVGVGGPAGSGGAALVGATGWRVGGARVDVSVGTDNVGDRARVGDAGAPVGEVA